MIRRQNQILIRSPQQVYYPHPPILKQQYQQLAQNQPNIQTNPPPIAGHPIIQKMVKHFQVENKDITEIILQSQMTFKFEQITNYQKLLNQYDRVLKFDLSDQRLLMHQVLVMEIQMQPQNMFWINWKNTQQICDFLEDMRNQIVNMMEIQQRKLKNGAQIAQKYHELRTSWIKMCEQVSHQLYGTFKQNLVQQFIEWINLVGSHAYLRKSVQFLIFIDHCLPIDKWNMLVYKQLYIRKPRGLFDKVKGIFSDQRVKRKPQYFLTVTSDGIIKSHDHLLLSRVQNMIPYTNYMFIKSERNNDYITYHIKSGRSEEWQINFYDDYISAINFACGLGRARIDAYYKAPYKIHDGTTIYSRQYYQKQDRQNTQPHRFKSFAPPRTKCGVKMYNDGCGYFQDLYACIMNAKYQICITDWMLTPYFLLRRPGTISDQNIQNRLDGVLAQAAARGVKIFIILYMQPAMFVNNDSQGAAKHLQKMHKNIKVLRHPNVAVPIIWSHHQKLCVIDQKIGFLGGLDLCYGRWDTPQHKLVQTISDRSQRLWDGCDYNNFKISDIYQPRNFNKSNLNQQFQVRMPWHDIALQMRGDAVIDLLRHFVQYWYFVKSQYKFSPRKFFSSFSKSQQNLKKRDVGRHIKEVVQENITENIETLKEDITQKYFSGKQVRISQLLIQQRTGLNEGNTNIQMLRSANDWSLGVDPNNPQMSIHQAYKDLIKNAQSHIYIQNQFFMGLKNEIVKTLCDRIIYAWNNKQNFKVIIVVPLLPGFQGDPGDPAATVLRIQIHWQKVAIKNGENSIYNRLERECPGINVSDYLFFFGLRKFDILKGSPITEIIYVHSKLMIVDDKRAICGSANINDRSLCGTGDSQIAVCIQENQRSQGQLFDLRSRIFDQHFKLTPQQCKQITSPKIWNLIISRAKNNTLIFRQVFGCIPDDQVTTHQQIQILKEKATYNTALLKNIIGHAVQYPLKFMDDEDLQFSLGQKEYFAPVQSFT